MQITSAMKMVSAAKLKRAQDAVIYLRPYAGKLHQILFNINQTIYKRYYQKPYFQMIAMLPDGTQKEFESVVNELAVFTDISKWHFIFTNTTNIKGVFKSLNTPFELNEHLYSNYAFIIDREQRLRGRKDDEDTSDGKLFGYNMRSVAVLKNKMKDDIDIIYYQLKKSAEKEARNKRKK